jgi:DNA-binding protein HU-beta
LVSILAQASETPRARVHLVLECLALIAADALGRGKRVRIPGIGILDAPISAPREGTGPDGKPYSVPARRRVRLRPSADLTRSVEVVRREWFPIDDAGGSGALAATGPATEADLNRLIAQQRADLEARAAKLAQAAEESAA